MNRNYLIIVSLLCFTINLFGQKSKFKPKTSPDHSILVKLGYVNSTAFGSDIDLRVRGGSNIKHRHSPMLEIDYNIEFFGRLYVQSGISMISTGAGIFGGTWLNQGNANITSLRIPLLIGLSSTNKSLTRFAIEAGLAYNIVVIDNINYSTYKDDNPVNTTSTIVGAKISRQLNKNRMIALHFNYFKDLSAYYIRNTASNSYEIWSKGYSLSLSFSFGN